MSTKSIGLAALLVATLCLQACAGGGGGTTNSASATVTTVSKAYAGSVQTVTRSDGTIVTNNAVSNSVTWASDHVTRTTTYTFPDGSSNPVTETVPGTTGTPTYSGSVQTIVTTYGDGATTTATNNATSNAVTWASDHVTRTTTYSFANGGTNAVVATVPGTAGTPTYSGSVQTIVTTYGDGATTTATNNAVSNAVTWAGDHVTKTTTYSFANGGTNSVVATVPGTVGTPTYSGSVQTIITTYGDGATTTATNNATSNAVTWASDHVTKTTTYSFANGGTNAVVATVPGTAGTPTYSGSVQTIVTTYGDGATSTATNSPVSNAVSWASDHITRTTTYTFANGGTNAVVATVPGTVGTPTYSGSVQTIVTTYGDGATTTATNNATSNAVTWASDHVTRTTTYSFANGGTNAVVTTVPGTAGTPTYSGNVQTIVTTYGDGATSTATNNPVSNAVAWASDHVTRTTTYTFANGGTNAVAERISPTTGNPTLTAANYPANWTTTGTVTGPSVSTSTVTYGDGYSYTQDGSQSRPFWQSTLSRNSIYDPNAVVYSTTTPYDLRWGTPDKDGPVISAAFSDGAVSDITLNSTLNFWGQIISGQCVLGPVAGFCLNGPTIGTPHPDVLAAWRQGWTGKGVNVMLEDSLLEDHGVVTALLVNRYALGSTLYGYNFKTNSGVYNRDGTTAIPSSLTNIGVVNASYGANLKLLIGHAQPWSDAELATAETAFVAFAQRTINRFNGITGFTNFSYTDAVIVKAAGNDSITADKEPLVKALATNALINPRLLVVGAITMAGFTNLPATISSYSNTAGADPSVRDRFLVASGTTPFGTGDIARNGVPINATTSVDPNGVNLGSVGTSYAAPRVAGFAAIIRQKFPNLDGTKTASILLDTARYDTLTCYSAAPSQFASTSGCDPSIYGRGEASLSRALAPVGRLR